jgi:hypothetical protein
VPKWIKACPGMIGAYAVINGSETLNSYGGSCSIRKHCPLENTLNLATLIAMPLSMLKSQRKKWRPR